MNRRLISVLLCSAILGGGLGIAALVVGLDASESASASDKTSDQRLPNVKIKAIESQTVEDRLILTGSVLPWEDVTISSEVMGKIEHKAVQEGDTVTTGRELFRIDTEAIQASLDQATAQAKLADQEFERIQKLLDKGVTTQRDEDSAIANRDVAAANVRALEIQLRKSVVKAPFDGIVDGLFQEADEFVDAGKPLARLVQVHKVKVQVGVPERDIPFFKEGDRATVRLDALSEREFEGEIRMLAPTADMLTHTFNAEIALDNSTGELRPGMIARVTLVRATYPDSIMVPIFATLLLDDVRYTYVVNDGIAELRPIETGIVQGDSVQITKGLNPGDQIIVSGQRDVRPGGAVKVQETLP